MSESWEERKRSKKIIRKLLGRKLNRIKQIKKRRIAKKLFKQCKNKN